MAKNKKKSGIGLYILGAVLMTVVNLVGNIFNFDVIYDFNIQQYSSNISNFHEDRYVKANINLNVYLEVLDMKEIELLTTGLIIPKGTNFKIQGYQNKVYLDWVAVTFFKKTEKIDGYILLNKNLGAVGVSELINKRTLKNNFFTELPEKTLKKYQSRQYQKYIDKILREYNIKKAVTAQDKQKAEESSLFELLYVKNNINYYFNKSDEIEVNKWYKLYRGSNFETIILNASKEYDPIKDGVYSEPAIKNIINTIYFKIFIVVLFILSLKLITSIISNIIGYVKSDSCSECGSKNISTTNSIITDEKYEYENKDGSPDLRRADNRIVQSIEVHEICNKCNAEWQYSIDEYK
jgi:hypothetical protein